MIHNIKKKLYWYSWRHLNCMSKPMETWETIIFVIGKATSPKQIYIIVYCNICVFDVNVNLFLWYTIVAFACSSLFLSLVLTWTDVLCAVNHFVTNVTFLTHLVVGLKADNTGIGGVQLIFTLIIASNRATFKYAEGI